MSGRSSPFWTERRAAPSHRYPKLGTGKESTDSDLTSGIDEAPRLQLALGQRHQGFKKKKCQFPH